MRRLIEKSFDDLREAMTGHRIVEWDENHITLDNGLRLVVEMTDSDCCAGAYGEFSEVELDAAITHVSDIKYSPWEDGDSYGCSAQVTIMHNQNLICMVTGDADAGNGGYYYSIASFIVHPAEGQSWQCEFVSSDDGDENDVQKVSYEDRCKPLSEFVF